jgi:hypothetical protein
MFPISTCINGKEIGRLSGVVVYKIYHSYHVDQSSRLSGVTSFVERSLPP